MPEVRAALININPSSSYFCFFIYFKFSQYTIKQCKRLDLFRTLSCTYRVFIFDFKPSFRNIYKNDSETRHNTRLCSVVYPTKNNIYFCSYSYRSSKKKSTGDERVYFIYEFRTKRQIVRVPIDAIEIFKVRTFFPNGIIRRDLYSTFQYKTTSEHNASTFHTTYGFKLTEHTASLHIDVGILWIYIL